MSKATKITLAEQQKLLESSTAVIKSEIYQMRKCLESKHKFMDALKHTSNFLNELRTSSLNPKQYYELYILVYDGLNYLSNYLKDNKSSTNNYLIDLYELVQYAGNIIPRLYLMITIGSIYMNNEDAPINEILNDMLEMCKGVQNPIRGLFLRYYLIQRTKAFLVKAENNDNLNKIISFIVSNFIEMNKLWVRLQHQGHSSERAKRVEERNELKILVGSNLVILSQLDCINTEMYNQKILPEILQQIVRCRDSIAQNYLLDVIIQIFPDNFQISSLKSFLNSLLMVNEDVNITALLTSLIDRLIYYKMRNNEILNDISFLSKFDDFIENLNKSHPEFDVQDYCLILNGILRLILAFSTEDTEILNHMDRIYKLSIDKFDLVQQQKTENKSSDGFKIILKSIENFDNFESFFQMNDENYFKLFKLQSIDVRNDIAKMILNNLIAGNIKITSDKNLDLIFKYIDESLLVNTEERISMSETKKDLFGAESETNLASNEGNSMLDENYETLSRFLHTVHNKDPLVYYQLLTSCEKHLSKGNKIKVFPTLISIFIKLIRKMNFLGTEKKELVKHFNKVSKYIDAIKVDLPIKSLNFNLNCAQIANECSLNNISYEFFIGSFIIYEEMIFESKIQIQCLMNIINKLITMDQMIVHNVTDFDKLITKATLYGSRLMKKSDQCRAIYNSSHLWWINSDDFDEHEDVVNEANKSQLSTTEAEASDEKEQELAVEDDELAPQVVLKKDDKRVLECLQKSLRIADSIMDSNVSIELFVEILNQSIYYFIHGNEMINIRYLNGLIELIGNNFKEISQSEGGITGAYSSTWSHYQRTLNYIKEQRAVDGRFHEIAV